MATPMSNHRLDDTRHSRHGDEPKTYDENPLPLDHDANRNLWDRIKRKCSDSWLIECLSAVLSVACVVALIIFLKVLDGKEPPSWNNRVSPNAIVSVLSTSAKATMMLVVAETIGQFKWLHIKKDRQSLKDVQVYDDATRGPLGAAHFLWRFRRAPSLTPWVFIGCFVTVLAIALDPFTQQILRYENRKVPQGIGSAYVSHAHTYDWGTKGISGVNGVITGLRDPGLTAVTIGALFDAPLALKTSCPSLNCTYPDFTTLGVASHCLDVTAQTAHNCSINPLNGEQFCKYALPGHVGLGASTVYGVSDGFSHTQANATTKGPLADDASTHETLVTAVSMILFPGDNNPNAAPTDTAWRKRLQAWQCTLKLVAYAYSNVTVKQGVLHTPIIRTSELNLVFDEDEEPLVYEAVDKDWPGDGKYRFGWGDSHNVPSILGLLNYQVYAGPGEQVESGNLFNNALAAGTSIPEKFDGIAVSMTHYIMQGSPNATRALGVALLEQTYIAVRWPWLVPLLCLVVLTWIFLLLGIAFTAAAEIRIWKSSLYPLLTLDIRGDSMRNGGAGTDWRLSQMEVLSSRQGAAVFASSRKTGPSKGEYAQIAQG